MLVILVVILTLPSHDTDVLTTVLYDFRLNPSECQLLEHFQAT